MVINFTRKLSEAKPHEKDAYYCVCRSMIDILGKVEITKEDEGKVNISSQFLSEGKEIKDLSFFFRFEDWGGSGGTFYYFLALKRLSVPSHIHGLYFETSENGAVNLSGSVTGSGYRAVEVRDGSHYNEYQYDGICTYLDSDLVVGGP